MHIATTLVNREVRMQANRKAIKQVAKMPATKRDKNQRGCQKKTESRQEGRQAKT